jgi:hypothetical protein
MKNHVFVILLFIFIGISVTFAQDAPQDSSSNGSMKPKRPAKTKICTISPGFALIDVAAFDQFLISSPGSKGFSQNFGLLGLESITECKRFIYGFTLQAGMSQKNTIMNYAGVTGQNVDYYGTYGNFLLHSGYSIISTERVKFYPIVGVGFGSVSGNYSRIDNQTIAQFASNPGVGGSITKHMACFDGALGLDLLFPSRCKRDGEASFGRAIGLRVGYTQGMGVGNWRFAGARILENPTYNPGIMYVKLQFGMFCKRGGENRCDARGCRR